MRITDEMVEKVAEVLWTENCRWVADYAALHRDEHRPTYPYERVAEVTKADLRVYARAVLEALNELDAEI